MPVSVTAAPPDPALYLHIRVLIGIILGLAVTRLVAGIGGLIQQPGDRKLWSVHLSWVAWAMIEVLAFWWWEFRLAQVVHWSLLLYAFVFVYAAMYYLLAVLIFPDNIKGYDDFQDYFMSRRGWFFGVAAATTAIDVADTAIKGDAYVASLGIEYPLRVAGLIAAFALGGWSRSLTVQRVLPIVILIYEISFFWRHYGTLS